MQRQTVELQPAFVLHTRRYRETSLIVELFTPSYGRVGLVAKGARSAKSMRKALLQPFSVLRVSWIAQGELGTLTTVEREDSPVELDGRALACGFYLNELLTRLLTRHDPHPQLFHCYVATLNRIVAKPEQAPALRIFEKRLLEEIGYGLNLDHDVASGAPIQSQLRYHYRMEQGPAAVDVGDEAHAGISGRTLIALHNEQSLDPDQLREARRLLQWALQHYLGDRPMKSRELLRAYAKAGTV